MSINFHPIDIRKLKKYDTHGSIQPCPDQYVGTLSMNKTIKIILEPRDNIDYDHAGFKYSSGHEYLEKNILIILESPHRYEYDAKFNSIALVMGKTACLLFERLGKHLMHSKMKINEGEYNLILCNAVQYQTSCGLNPINRELRNSNWLEIYKEYNGEDDFKERVFAIKPRYTINLCTGGKSISGLRQKVSESLDLWGLKKHKHYTEGNHPASWDMTTDQNFSMID